MSHVNIPRVGFGSQRATGNFQGGCGLAALSAAYVHAFDLHFCQGRLHAADCGIGVIAVFAEMAKDDVMKVIVRDGLNEFRDLLIREMAVAGADALLGSPGALGIRLKEVGVVIRFDEKGVGALEAILDQPGDEADIAEDTELGLRILNDEPDWIHCIVRHGETLNAKVLEIKGATGLHELPARFAFGMQTLHDRLLGEWRAEQGYGMLPANDVNSAGVIAVLVAEEDAVDGVNTHAR